MVYIGATVRVSKGETAATPATGGCTKNNMTSNSTSTVSYLEVPDAMTAPTTWPPAEPLALPTKYDLDPFQKHAVLGIHAGDHVFVTAKTGSGKTFVGEYLIARALAAGKRVFYTTPIKSLSNQKYHDLKKLFPTATVGILTGDIKMQPDAQIVVMTAEILRNLFYKRGTATEGVGLTAAISLEGVVGVVMDEVHYIQDPDRGHVWEESMILCPRELQLVLLSATMPSAASLAGWLANLHQRRTWLLSTTYRVVPLVHGVLTGAGESWSVVPLLDTAGGWIGDAYTGWLRGRKAIEEAAAAHKKAVDARRRDGYAAPPPSAKVRVESSMQRLRRTVNWLEMTKQLPALFFIFSRKECERLASQVDGSLIDTSDQAAAANIIDFHLSRHRSILEKSPQYHQIRELLLRGIAFHHSGLQPLLKEIVEILFGRGYVKVLFATETFSVGLNMPTKTVVFLELRKFSDGGEKRLLRPDEYIQMAGRAGRRGLDKQGLVLYEPLNDPVENYELKSLLTGALPALESRMRFHYDFILKHHLTNGLLPIAEQSYWAVQQRATRVSLGIELVSAEAALVSAKAAFTPSQKEKIAEKKALEAEVAGSMNAKRKKAQLALNRWLDEHRGSSLDLLEKSWQRLQEAQGAHDRLQRQITAWDAAPLLALGPQEACLSRWGLLDKAGQLTTMGRAATEVNEGHNILMPVLAESGHLDGLTAEEVACVLAGFLHEGGGREEDAPSLSDSGLDAGAIAALEWVNDQAQGLQMDEDAYRAHSPANFWNLSSLWISVTARWLAGAGLTEIAQEFGLFEGNVQRGLMRVANLLEEWGSIATLRSDLAMLEKIRALTFLRDEVVVDSLYLRM
jgi:superfamily II RNA helicase